MWEVGDRVVVSSAFKPKVKGTGIAIDAESVMPVLVEIDGIGTGMWFYENGDDLIWSDITCT